MSLNPISSIALQTTVVVTTIGFTPAQSTLRPGALVIVALCTGYCLSTALTYFLRTPWASLAGGYSVMLLFHFIDIALLTKWQFPHSGSFSVDTSRAIPRGTSWVDHLRFGIWAAFNARCIGTSEQVRNIPASRDQGRDVFLRRTAGLVLLSYLGLDILGSAADPELGSRFLVVSRVPFIRRLSEITVEEVVIRICSTIAAGIAFYAAREDLTIYLRLSVCFSNPVIHETGLPSTVRCRMLIPCDGYGVASGISPILTNSVQLLDFWPRIFFAYLQGYCGLDIHKF
ncbi:hypothetical protein AARAC_008632 [Aspergillus arachidicola]|uniref:Wax synthase domain-containing protein n=1 Tax=Aspergillus arachidicola TaxID=656916 RepID=A0A2G7FTP8_9EURO|nr:hypothetical protein AARAC_008632 [Aspergillus arachidicola]